MAAAAVVVDAVVAEVEDEMVGAKALVVVSQKAKTYVENPIWIQLSQEAKDIIMNSQGRKTAEQYCKINATQMTYGTVVTPKALWLKLPTGAPTAFTNHNKTITPGSQTSQANTHTQVLNAAQVVQMMN